MVNVTTKIIDAKVLEILKKVATDVESNCAIKETKMEKGVELSIDFKSIVESEEFYRIIRGKGIHTSFSGEN